MIKKLCYVVRVLLYVLRQLLACDLYERIMEETEDEQDLH